MQTVARPCKLRQASRSRASLPLCCEMLWLLPATSEPWQRRKAEPTKNEQLPGGWQALQGGASGGVEDRLGRGRQRQCCAVQVSGWAAPVTGSRDSRGMRGTQGSLETSIHGLCETKQQHQGKMHAGRERCQLSAGLLLVASEGPRRAPQREQRAPKAACNVQEVMRVGTTSVRRN